MANAGAVMAAAPVAISGGDIRCFLFDAFLRCESFSIHPRRVEQRLPIGAVFRPRKGMRRGFINERSVIEPPGIHVFDDPKHVAGTFGLFYY